VIDSCGSSPAEKANFLGRDLIKRARLEQEELDENMDANREFGHRKVEVILIQDHPY
jgi:hypothetical protein